MVKEKPSFFSQGSYGCTTFPPITCKTVNPHVRNISKVVKNDFFSKHELHLGKRLSEIVEKEHIKDSKLFLYYYQSCETNRQLLKKEHGFYEKCKLFEDSATLPKHDSFVILYGEYVSSITNSLFFKQHFTLKNIYLFYSFSLKALSILKKYKIIHMDLNSRNIIVSNINPPTFHMIDFGLSLEGPKCYQSNGELNLEYLKYFLIYEPTYYFWSMDRHIISYLFHKRAIPNQSQLKELIHTVLSSDAWLKQFYGTSYDTYVQDTCTYYEKKCSSSTSFMDLMVHIWKETCYTWHMFSISYFCLKQIHMNVLKIQVNEGYDDFCTLLKKNIHFDYTRRPNIQLQINEFLKLLKK